MLGTTPDLGEEPGNLSVEIGELGMGGAWFRPQNHLASERQQRLVLTPEDAEAALDLVAHHGMPDGIGDREADLVIVIAGIIGGIRVIAGIRRLPGGKRTHRGSAPRMQNALLPCLFRGEGVMNDYIGAGHTLVTAQDTDELSMIFQTPHQAPPECVPSAAVGCITLAGTADCRENLYQNLCRGTVVFMAGVPYRLRR
jgi:hypothetical protein